MNSKLLHLLYYSNVSPVANVPVACLGEPNQAKLYEKAFGSLPVQPDKHGFVDLLAQVLAAVGGLQLPKLKDTFVLIDAYVPWFSSGKSLRYLKGLSLPGLDLMRTYSKQLQLKPKHVKTVWQVCQDYLAEQGYEEQSMDQWQKLPAAERGQVALNAVAQLFADSSIIIAKGFARNLPSNAVEISNNWAHWDVNFTYEQCLQLLKAAIAAFGSAHPADKNAFTLNGNLLRIGNQAIVLERERIVFGASRYVRHGLLAVAYGQEESQPGDLLAATPYTLFVYGMVYALRELQQGSLQRFYRALETFLPLDTEEQTMAGEDGDRQLLLENRFSPVLVTGVPPLQAVGSSFKVGQPLHHYHVGTLVDNESDTTNADPAYHKLMPAVGAHDILALRQFGLVKHITAGSYSYVSARLNAVLLRNIPEAYRRQYLLDAVASIYKVAPEPEAVAAELRKQHGESLDGLVTAEEVLSYCEQQGVIPITNKVSKPKRAMAEFALCAELVNGKLRHFTRFNQAPADGVELKAIIAPLMYAPGVAILTKSDDIDTRYVVSTSQSESFSGYFEVHTKQVQLSPIVSNGKLEKVEAGQLSSKDRLAQYCLYFEPLTYWVEKGDLLLTFTERSTGIQRFVFATNSGFLKDIQWSKRTFGQTPVVEVKVRTSKVYSVRDGFKARGAEIKALVHPGLNDDVVQGDFLHNVVVTNDTLKGTDLLSGILPVAVQTMWESPIEECRVAVREAAKLSGVDNGKFIYSELIAAQGGYQPLLDVFNRYYLQQDVWFKFSSLYAGPTGWTAVRNLIRAKQQEFTLLEDFQLPEAAQGLENVEVYKHSSGNILVFGERDGLLEVHQRCPYVYAGTAETGPVLVNWKVELSSVQQAVTTTPTQASVIRYVAEAGDSAFAQALADDGQKYLNHYVMFQAGYKNLDVQDEDFGFPLRRIPLVNGSLRFYAALILGRHYGELPKGLLAGARFLAELDEKEFQALLTRVTQQALQDQVLAELLAAGLNRRVITLKAYVGEGEDIETRHFWLHLGSLLDQEGTTKNATTLLGRFLSLIVTVLLGGTAQQTIINGLYGNLTALVNSNKGQRRLVVGRTGLNSKSVALPGLDPSKLYVKYSQNPDSFYSRFAQLVNTPHLHGRKVLLSRAPMNAAAVLYIETVRPGHPLYTRMNEYQVVTDLMVIYVDAGDCDGDGRTVVDAESCVLAPASVPEIEQMIQARTGRTPAEESNYLADHLLGFKDFRKTKRTFTLLGRNNLLNEASPANWTSDYAQLIHRAHYLNVVLVGIAYRVAEYGDRFIELYQHLKDEDKVLHAQLDWALPVYNLYETLLGGLSKEMYAFVQGWLRPMCTPRREANVDYSLLASAYQGVKGADAAPLRYLMAASGLNERMFDALVTLTNDIVQAKKLPAKLAEIIQEHPEEELPQEFAEFIESNWLLVTAHLHYKLAKGEPVFDELHLPLFAALSLSTDFAAHEKSIVVHQLKRVMQYVLPLYLPSPNPPMVKFKKRRSRTITRHTPLSVVSSGLTPETMTADQARVYEAFISGKNVVYSGAAGTGKTTLAKYLIATARNDKDNHVIVMSTTGNGAKVLGCGATTVHRMVGLGPEGACLPAGEARPHGYKHKLADNLIADVRIRNRLAKPGKRTVVFIDEVYRLSPQTLRITLDVIKAVSGGNVQFVLFGDPAQGAPVPAHPDDPVEFTWQEPKWRLRDADGQVTREITRPALDLKEFKLVTLEQVVRQSSDTEYACMLNRIRVGDRSADVLNFFKQRTKGTTATQPDNTSTYLYASNAEVAEHNARVVAAAISAGAPHRNYIAKFNGETLTDVESWQKQYPDIAREVEPISPCLQLVEGMRVMVRQECRSLEDRDLHNGEEGVIVKLWPNHIQVQLDGSDKPVSIGPVQIHLPMQYDGTDHPDTYEQLPVCLSAAMTVAKSQGITKHVQYDEQGKVLPSSLLVVKTYYNSGRPSITNPGDLYVALSRTEVVEQLIIDHEWQGVSTFGSCIVADPEVIAYLQRGCGVTRIKLGGIYYAVKLVKSAHPVYEVEIEGIDTFTVSVQHGFVTATTADGHPIPITDIGLQAALTLIREELTPPTFKYHETKLVQKKGITWTYHKFYVEGQPELTVQLQDQAAVNAPGYKVMVGNVTTRTVLATCNYVESVSEYLWYEEVVRAIPSGDGPDRPRKIISGGQTGADRGGLEAAKALGIETGGTAANRYLTEAGSDPSLANYGLTASGTYASRTLRNVQDSDGTLIVAPNPDSTGTKLTIQHCQQEGKPYLLNPTPTELKEWVRDKKISCLNVAGNRESVSPGVGQRTYELLMSAFGNKAALAAESLGEVVHTKMHSYDVRVGRPTNWSNPFSHLPYSSAVHHPDLKTKEDSVRAYEQWLLHNDTSLFTLSVQQKQKLDEQREWILAHVNELRGKRLACWCVKNPTPPTVEPRSCHAMSLLLLAAGRLA